MGTPLDKIYDILDTLKSQDNVFTDSTIPIKFCRIGVIQASISLKKEFPMTSVTEETPGGEKIEKWYIEAPITDKELYLAGLYAYRNYAIKQHDELTGKALNFKTISFAVTGLTERAKEAMRIVWWCDTEINKVLKSMQPSVGSAVEMAGDGIG